MGTDQKPLRTRVRDFVHSMIDRSGSFKCVVTRESDLNPEVFAGFPFAWVTLGAAQDQMQGMHGDLVPTLLEVMVEVGVHDAEDPEAALDRQLQILDNIVLADVRMSEQVVRIFPVSVEAPVVIPKQGWAFTTRRYQVDMDVEFANA